MQVPVRSILGLARIPAHRTSAVSWLKRYGATIEKAPCNGGFQDVVTLSDLPADVCRAIVEREIAASGLPLGTYDEAAHTALASATANTRNAAEVKAAIARDLAALGSQVPWAERMAIIRGRHGADGTSKPSLMRISKAIEGVDPINFAPALLADYSREGAPKANMSEAA